MDKSFRTILAEQMNEGNGAPSAASATSFTRAQEVWIGALEWSNPSASIAKPASAYAREARLSREAARRAARPVSEPVIALVRLSNADLADVRRLIELGGVDLTEGISPRRLKATYRRLALAYHPDTSTHADHEAFLDVRAIYGRLLGRLSSY